MPIAGIGQGLGLGGGTSATASGAPAGGGGGSEISIALNATEATIIGALHESDDEGTIAYGTDTDAIYVHRGNGWWDRYDKDGTA